MYRLLEVRLDDLGTHVTVEDLITILKNMNAANIHDKKALSNHSSVENI